MPLYGYCVAGFSKVKPTLIALLPNDHRLSVEAFCIQCMLLHEKRVRESYVYYAVCDLQYCAHTCSMFVPLEDL